MLNRIFKIEINMPTVILSVFWNTACSWIFVLQHKLPAFSAVYWQVNQPNKSSCYVLSSSANTTKYQLSALSSRPLRLLQLYDLWPLTPNLSNLMKKDVFVPLVLLRSANTTVVLKIKDMELLSLDETFKWYSVDVAWFSAWKHE
jgi:hypothetical protein